jgi:hypothetical protein
MLAFLVHLDTPHPSSSGSPGGDKVPWELFDADKWDPNTGQRVKRGTWNPVRGY